jgi:hypothetical protein
MRLVDQRTRDGSRHFARFPQAATWGAICDHVMLLPGAEMVNFVAEWPARAWLDFRFRRHRFLINARDGLFHLFVRDPQCPDLILYQVGYHFERLLGQPAHDRKSRAHLAEGAGPVASRPRPTISGPSKLN